MDHVATKWVDSICMVSVLDIETKVWVKTPALWEVRSVRFVIILLPFKEKCWPLSNTRFTGTRRRGC